MNGVFLQGVTVLSVVAGTAVGLKFFPLLRWLHNLLKRYDQRMQYRSLSRHRDAMEQAYSQNKISLAWYAMIRITDVDDVSIEDNYILSESRHCINVDLHFRWWRRTRTKRRVLAAAHAWFRHRNEFQNCSVIVTIRRMR